MNLESFLATVDEEYSLSFSDLRERLYSQLDYLAFKNADQNISGFESFLKRFRIKTVTNDSVFLLLEQIELKQYISMSNNRCAARINKAKALYSFLYGGMIGLALFLSFLKKTLHN